MTLEVNAEKHGLRVKALIITADLLTHSAIQNIDKDYIEVILGRIKTQLNIILTEAAAAKKP